MSAQSIEPHKIKVVYIDDFPPALDQFRRQFGGKFGSVECLAPDLIDRQIDRVTDADLLVCDLKLTSPIENGNRRVRYTDGVSLLKSLGDKCPPAMILTGSISGHSVARLASQSADSEGNTAFRVALKSAPQELLFNQMLGAVKDGQSILPAKRAKVLSSLDVSEKELTQPDIALNNSAARVIERVQSYVQKYSDVILALKTDCNLSEWPSWKSSGNLLEQQSELFRKLNSKILCGNGAEDLLNCLHDLRARAIMLDPDFIRLPEEGTVNFSSDPTKLISTLKIEYKALTKVIQDTYIQADKFCNPVYEFEKQMQNLFGTDLDNNFYYEDPKVRSRIKIQDPGRNIEGLFGKLKEIFSDSLSWPEFRYMQQYLGPARFSHEKTLREKLNWGSGIQIRIRTFSPDLEARKWGDILDPARDFIQRLIAAKVFYAEPAIFSRLNDNYEDNIFEFYIKISDLDKEAFDREQNRISNISLQKEQEFKYFDDTIKVQYINVPSGNLIILDHDIEYMDLAETGGDYSLLEYQDKIILVSSSDGHMCNDILFCHYLVKCMGMSAEDAYDLASRSVRIKAQGGSFNFDTKDKLLLERVGPILLDLGVKKIVAFPEDFFSRNYMYPFIIDDLKLNESHD